MYWSIFLTDIECIYKLIVECKLLGIHFFKLRLARSFVLLLFGFSGFLLMASVCVLLCWCSLDTWIERGREVSLVICKSFQQMYLLAILKLLLLGFDPAVKYKLYLSVTHVWPVSIVLISFIKSCVKVHQVILHVIILRIKCYCIVWKRCVPVF